MAILRIGDLVIDNFRREGIVVSAERCPSKKWLREQDDTRVQTAVGPWWKVLPLEGGAIVLADDLGTFVRRATIDDVLTLVDSQQSEHAGQVTLNELLGRLRLTKTTRMPNRPRKKRRVRNSARVSSQQSL